MNILENYQKAKQAIYDHVGFVEDWVIYPIDDCTRYVWKIIGTNLFEQKIQYANSVKQLNDKDVGDYYSAEIYTQRFYEKWVYPGEQYTMVFMDPHTDGMKYFAIFDNALKCS